MSTDFDSQDAVEAYAAEHGDEGLRGMLAQGRLVGRRKSNVELYLNRKDAIARQDEDRQRATQQAAHAVRGVDAVEQTAETLRAWKADEIPRTERSERVAAKSFWIGVATLVASIIAAIAAVIALFKP